MKDKDKSQDSMLVDSFPLPEILTFLCIILKLSGRNEDSREHNNIQSTGKIASLKLKHSDIILSEG